MLLMAWSPVRRFNAGCFEVEHPGDYATLNSYQLRDGTEIRRPVFSLLDRGPLYKSCTFIPYRVVTDLAGMKHLAHMSDTILDEYDEPAEDV